MQCEWCTAWHAFAFFQSLGHSPTAAVRQSDGPATRRRSTWMCRAPSLASSRRPPVNAQLESTCVRIKLWAPASRPYSGAFRAAKSKFSRCAGTSARRRTDASSRAARRQADSKVHDAARRRESASAAAAPEASRREGGQQSAGGQQEAALRRAPAPRANAAPASGRSGAASGRCQCPLPTKTNCSSSLPRAAQPRAQAA